MILPKPHWIRTKWHEPGKYNRISGLLEKYNVNTVCRSAKCPNIGECFGNNHMTFLILGNVCTRRCGFCSVKKGKPLPPSLEEIDNILEIIGFLELEHVIITSVARDDLPDGGAGMFSEAVKRIKNRFEYIKIEILTPDFLGIVPENILEVKPYIWAHNVETVPRLYGEIRGQADYTRSIALLESIKLNPVRVRHAEGMATAALGRSASNGVKRNDILTKSGIMLGLGENEEEVLGVFSELKRVNVDIITIGQYLKPEKDCVEVKRFVSPEEFEWYGKKAAEFGFRYIMSGPLVRSSYKIFNPPQAGWIS